jgi:periplasmic divalent cation tolerance protein
MCTVGNEENAGLIAGALVEEKLAACVNVVPKVRSVYSWKGEIVEDSELLLIIKTRSELYEKVEERIKELHNYEVPEIIAFDIAKGSKEYLDWIAGSV